MRAADYSCWQAAHEPDKRNILAEGAERGSNPELRRASPALRPATASSAISLPEGDMIRWRAVCTWCGILKGFYANL